MNVRLRAEDFQDLRKALVGLGEVDDPEACDRILAAFDAAATRAEQLGGESA